MEIRTFLTRLDAVFYYGHAGERSEEIAVRAGDHVGEGRNGGVADEGLAVSVHGELKRTV